MTLFQKLKKIPNNLAIVFISIYRLIFSPSSGFLRFLPFYPRNTCIFYPTCSLYSKECFKKYPFIKALKKTIVRVGRCHPGNPPAVDLP